MSKSIYIIDRRVSNYQLLIDGLPEGADWILLNLNQDGLVQIASALSSTPALSSIHIISHGSAGSVYLGSTVLTGNNLDNYSTILGQIGSHLTAEGDILLYGCDVAFGANGLAFIERFSALTGADVAASSDLTGNAASGGNLLLERSTGPIETQALQNFDATSTLTTTPYLINKPSSWTFSEDGSTSFEIVLSFATPENVQITVSLSDGLCWLDGTTAPKVFAFTSVNFAQPQTIIFKANDDLVIEGDLLHYVSLSFASSDPVFNGLYQ